MSFEIAFQKYLEYIKLTYWSGVLYTLTYFISLFLAFYIPGRVIAKYLLKWKYQYRAQDLFYATVLGMVSYFVVMSFLFSWYFPPHFFAKYQAYILIAINLGCYGFWLRKNKLGDLMPIRRMPQWASVLTLGLCLLAIYIHTFWRPMPGDVGGQINGYLISAILNEPTFPVLPLIPKLNISYESSAFPTIHVFLSLFDHFVPMTYLLRIAIVGNLLICLTGLYLLMRKQFNQVLAIWTIAFTVGHVFYMEMLSQTRVTEPFAWVFLLALVSLIIRKEFWDEKKNLTCILAGVLAGTMGLIHAKLYFWFALGLVVFFVLSLQLRKPKVTSAVFQKAGILLVVSLLFSGMWLLAHGKVFVAQFEPLGWNFLSHFKPRTNESFRYIAFSFYCVGLGVLLIDWYKSKELNPFKKFVLAFFIVGIFFGGEFFKAYGDTFLLPVVLLMGTVFIFHHLRIESLIFKSKSLAIAIVVLFLSVNSYYKYSWFHLGCLGDWDDLALYHHIKRTTEYKDVFILNSPALEGDWVPSDAARKSIFSRVVRSGGNVTGQHGKILNYLKEAYYRPKEETYQVLKKVGITHVVLSGMFKKENLEAINAWRNISWVKPLQAFDNQQDGVPSVIFQVK